MKVHYINILLFAHALNILVKKCHLNSAPKYPSIITPHHTQTNRSLCECDLYMPNYDNDPQMKKVMQQFEDRTTQRFHEYDERMKTTRQKCKDQCDKEIQKIILKDKLEKQMAQQLTTLETKITTDNIPTCVCKKSVAEKMEKGCLKCTQNLGGIVAPSSGVLVGIAEGALYSWKPTALKIAIAKAITEGTAQITAAGEAARIQTGVDALIEGLNALNIGEFNIGPWIPFINAGDYTEVSKIVNIIFDKKTQMCGLNRTLSDTRCQEIGTRLGLISLNGEQPPPDKDAIRQTVTKIVEETKGPAAKAAEAASESVAAEITKEQTALIEGGFNSTISSINAAIIAIVVIVLIMIIIYLILRYRRKKKMKKKLQYIKLLEE
ncbi:rifin [Plasmodium reichenowi]|uniref:Rifin n=1 Tax=Plasmodium reichenowi TaxID=5854 RepID=A0A060RQ94_PLARE|nr:rifin [Plasmodium reichenowi]